MMRLSYAAILVCGLCGVAAAQKLIDPAVGRKLEGSLSPDSTLNCDFSRIEPRLSYRLQMQFGYTVSLPLVQLPGKGHKLWALLRVTPRDVAGAQPAFFLRNYELPPVLNGQFSARFWGAVDAGDGAYDIATTVFDEQHRSCSSEWQVRVAPSREEQAGILGMPAHTVAELTGATPQDSARRAAHSVGRLTILLHAAPTAAGQAVLSEQDVAMLMNALAAVMEEVPAREVRVGIFSLAEQQEYFRQNSFSFQDIGRAADALGKVQQATVDVDRLLRAKPALEELGDLLKRELTDPAPPDLIIFLGPPGMSSDRIPKNLVHAGQQIGAPIFYIECATRAGYRWVDPADFGLGEPRPPLVTPGAEIPTPVPFSKPQPRMEPGPGANSNEFNTIRYTVTALKGKTFLVFRPLDFARALDQIVAAVNQQKH
jgi:hypothetical protein